MYVYKTLSCNVLQQPTRVAQAWAVRAGVPHMSRTPQASPRRAAPQDPDRNPPRGARDSRRAGAQILPSRATLRLAGRRASRAEWRPHGRKGGSLRHGATHSPHLPLSASSRSRMSTLMHSFFPSFAIETPS